MCIRDRFGYIEVDDPERWAAGADTAINRSNAPVTCPSGSYQQMVDYLRGL